MSLSTRIAKAGPLKPEIQLSQAVDEFESVLTDSQQAQLKAHRLQSPSRSDDKLVLALTAEIDRENSRRRSRCVGARLTNLLDSVQQFSTVVDSVVGSFSSPIAGAVWGVLKITLKAATAYSSYFDKVSELFMAIGRSCPRYSEFGLLYPTSTRLQHALCQYFCVVVRLCKQSVVFMKRNFVSQISSSLWKPFETEFGPLQKDLERLVAVVRDEVSVASSAEQQAEIARLALDRKENAGRYSLLARFREDVTQELQRAQLRRQEKAKRKLLDACSTYNHQTTWKQARKKGNSTWILALDQYKQWKSKLASETLWCTGMIGAGKTVLSANVVEDLKLTLSPTHVVSFFFCRYDDSESMKARSVLGSVARQLLTVLNPQDVDSSHIPLRPDIDELLDILRNLLPRDRVYVAVIDGIDECEEKEAKLLAEGLESLLSSLSLTFKLYCASRPDILRWLPLSLVPKWHVDMSIAIAESQISQYIEAELEDCLQSERLRLGDPEIVITIRDALVEGAKGMFLWVAFQIQSICSQSNDEDILQSLQALPHDLPETYNRIMEQLRSSNLENGRRVYMMVSAAERPLTLNELREMLSVEPENTTWNKHRLINNMTQYLACCGSLIVVDEEDLTVQFAHHSVKQHLTSVAANVRLTYYHFSPEAASYGLGLICITYLSYQEINEVLAGKETQSQVLASSESTKTPRVVPNLALEIVQYSLPHENVANKVALRFLKNRSKVNWPAVNALRSAQTGERYPFLAYAKQHWLLHTAGFPKASSAVALWTFVASDKSGGLASPWTSSQLSDLDDPSSLFEWIILHNHELLLTHRLEMGDFSCINTSGSELPEVPALLESLLSKAIIEDKKNLARVVLRSKCAIKDAAKWAPLLACGDMGLWQEYLYSGGEPFSWTNNIDLHWPSIRAAINESPLTKAFPNVRTDLKWTPAMIAAATDQLGVLESMLKSFKVHMKKHMSLVFRSAAVCGKERILFRLLRPDIEADWAAEDPNGWPPLFYAAAICSTEVVTQLLRKFGVHVSMLNEKGLSARVIADKIHNTSVTAFLDDRQSRFGVHT